jgi:signal transduction histidine kinase
VGLPDVPGTSGALGLRGMRERALQVGGVVVASRIEPQGTRVAVRIPGGP